MEPNDELFALHWDRLDLWMQKQIDMRLKWHFWTGFAVGALAGIAACVASFMIAGAA